ncbi:MAG: right-handed parallel beta-helix repeat-containing protein, partial [Candidatus Aenigmatarchaeota archaeon]
MINRNLLFLFIFAFLFLAFSSNVFINNLPYSSGYYVVNANVTNQLFNITINNTESVNIIQVNITLPLEFSYVPNSNGTNSYFESFIYDDFSKTLSWYNSSGLVLSNSFNNFWFRANVSNIGIYNLSASLLYSNGSVEVINVSISVSVLNLYVSMNVSNNSVINAGSIVKIFGNISFYNASGIYYPNVSIYLDNSFVVELKPDNYGNFSYDLQIPEIIYKNFTIKVNSTFNGLYSETNFILTTSRNITYSGYYVLTQDILNINDTYGINISSDNVILDCLNKTIDGTFSLNGAPNSNNYGIYVYGKNVSIRNCYIRDWQVGIFLSSISNNSVIENNNIFNIFGSSNGGNAIAIFISSSNNVIRYNQIYNLTGGTGG